MISTSSSLPRVVAQACLGVVTASACSPGGPWAGLMRFLLRGNREEELNLLLSQATERAAQIALGMGGTSLVDLRYQVIPSFWGQIIVVCYGTAIWSTAVPQPASLSAR